MSFSLIPQYSFNSISDVPVDFLKRLGITLLLLDLDNTLAPYDTLTPSAEIALWAETIRKAGIDLFILTNNRGSERVSKLADAFKMGYIMGAKKPSASGVNRALAQLDRTPEETALIGDQIFTDIIAANSAGITSIVTKPIKLTNPLLAVRYGLEAPFRVMRRRHDKKEQA